MSWFRSCCSKNKKAEDVKELDFNRSGLIEVPNDVFEAQQTLEVLSLEGNKLTELPRHLFQCEELRVLNVGDNGLEKVPPLIGKLKQLQFLNLSRNCLRHSDIPASIAECEKLTVLDLSGNTQLCRLPEAIFSITSLQEIYLNDTDINFLPANIGKLHNLKIFEICENMINSLPLSMKRLNLLQRVDLSFNDIHQLPPVLSDLPNLSELWVSTNCFSVIPPSYGNLRKLTVFDASSNDIETLPPEIGNWCRLTTLILSNNSISEIPETIGNLRCLQTLNLECNYIGELPHSIGKLTQLEELNVQNNYISVVPSTIGFLRKLTFLSVSFNNLKFLPAEIGSCSSLTVLYALNNQLTKLPDEVGHLHKLTTLGLIGNRIEYLPIPISNLPNLRALWLARNQTHPLIPLQTEVHYKSGQLMLTCFLLPQTDERANSGRKTTAEVQETPQHQQHERHICFKEANSSHENFARLMRAPTPYPKDLQRYQRSATNILKRQKQAKTTPETNQFTNSALPQIREAVVMATTAVQQPNAEDTFSTTTVAVESASPSLQNQENESERDDIAAEFVTLRQPGPPPYHVAALYSKNAQFFSNINKPTNEECEKNEPPRYFVQDQPRDILMPQPQHGVPSNVFVNEVQRGGDDGGDAQRKIDMPWMFGQHKNRRVMEFSLTPCCYVPGFSVSLGQTGVYVDEVYEDGNAYMKLEPGDKILHIDEVDVTEMDPEQAAKIIMMRAPEADSIIISRNS